VQKDFADLAQETKQFYKRSLFFSYKKDSKTYAAEDTFKPIPESVGVLQVLVDAEVKKDATLRFDVIGYSLGGVIALEFAKKLANEASPLLSNVGYVVTIDSPVNGSLLLRSTPFWPDWVLTMVGKLWSPGAAQSRAAKDLGDMNKNATLQSTNEQTAANLRARGVQVLTLTSKDDVIICVEEATLTGFARAYALGNKMPPGAGLPCALAVTRRVEVTGDPGEFLGHTQALRSKEVIADLKAALGK